MRGQWVRLTNTLTEAFQNHSYPAPVQRLLAAQFAAVAMFADNLKFNGALSLQSKGELALLRSLAECREQHKLRGIAHLNSDHAYPSSERLGDWLGPGKLALSLVEEKTNHVLQQALLELTSDDLSEDLENYFTRSEQLPTMIFFAHQKSTVTALLLQRLPAPTEASEMALEGHENAWQTAEALAQTLRGDPQNELANLAPKDLLNRLFHEFPCRLHPPRMLTYACTCSRTKSDRTLLTLGPEELQEILDELGHIQVDCEFCGRGYSYDAQAVAQLSENGPQSEENNLH